LNEILRGGLAVRVFLCFAAGLLLSYALRAINAVIAPSLVAEFGLTNAELGALASAYFLSFAILQLPLGVWLDRFGSRRTNALLLTIAALGCLAFALSTTPWMLWLSRALIGVGVCGALMSALRAFRFWYAPERQQQLAAWILVAGSLGALTATVPVHALLPLVGWRGVFGISAVLLAAVAAALWWLLPAEPRQPVQSLASQWGGYLQVFGEPYFWRYVIPMMMVQSSFVAFQGLWAGPWFVNVLGMDPAGSAQALFVMNLLLMVAYLLFGAVLPGWVRRGWTVPRLVAWGGLLMLMSLSMISLASGPWAWLLWLPHLPARADRARLLGLEPDDVRWHVPDPVAVRCGDRPDGRHRRHRPWRAGLPSRDGSLGGLAGAGLPADDRLAGAAASGAARGLDGRRIHRRVVADPIRAV
jgi:MFS family permease